MPKSIKDLIYFDFEKAKSLLSQLNDGLISEISRATEGEKGDDASIGFDLKVIKGNVGESNKEKSLRTEKISLYHEILNTIEVELEKNKLLTDLNDSFDSTHGNFESFRKSLINVSYIKSNGWGNFEDFDRFKRIFTNFNDVQRLIYHSQISENEEVLVLRKQLDGHKKNVNSGNERNVKAKDLAKIKAIEKNLDNLLMENAEIHLFDNEWIERVKKFLDTFSPNRLNFRLLPIDEYPKFQIISNLKDKYMLDGNFENTIFTYGSRPNIKLTVLGIVTSCPQIEDPRINPSDEFSEIEDEDLPDGVQFEKAFRNVFGSFEAFEKIFFVPSYPKIAISPIAIYREVKIGK